MAPKTAAFVASTEKFVAAQGVDLVSFGKHQRKDDITMQYLHQFDADEGVLYVGRAQEKARVVRTERRHCARTGMSYPWVVDGSAMVNHYYFDCVDSDFGPFFLKFCSYFPYNARLCINGNEYAKCQLRKRGIVFEALDNGILSCDDPRALQRICGGSMSARLIGCCASGGHDCRIRSSVTIEPRATATRCRSCRPSSR